MEMVGRSHEVRYIGQMRNGMWLAFTAAAVNQVRIANIEATMSQIPILRG